MNFKKLAVAASLIAGASAALFSTSATALPDSARMYTYYSDASMTVVVGESGNGCKSGYSWGVKTAYVTYETFKCA